MRHTFLIFEQIHIFLSSARTVSSNRDFGVEQFFRADEFRASPKNTRNKKFMDALGDGVLQQVPYRLVRDCGQDMYPEVSI